jgi:hypothetical protein
VRTWPGLAAVGAGLIHLGGSAGAVPAVLVPLLLVGIAEVLWGVLALSRPVPPMAASAAPATALALVGTVVALLLPSSAARHGAAVSFGVPAGVFGGAGALDLALGVLLAVHLGRGRPESAPSRPVRFVLEAAAGAAVVAVVVTQSLAATSAGGSMPMHMG